jgi:hypothetical protein
MKLSWTLIDDQRGTSNAASVPLVLALPPFMENGN